MKVNANTLRPGNLVEHNGKLWVVLKYEFTQPGKGGAVMQVELRDIVAGNKDNVRFRTHETVEKIRLDEETYQYLFNDGDNYTFMNTATYEQIVIGAAVIGEAAPFLQDGMTVQVESHEGRHLRVEIPETVIMEVVEAEPVVKGQTASSSYKPAILENGLKVMVPPHIEIGNKIVVKTTDSSYVERAKS